jgi:hypothetical protein
MEFDVSNLRDDELRELLAKCLWSGRRDLQLPLELLQI